MKSKVIQKTLNPAICIDSCPSCGTRDLIRLSVDVICAKCDWNSAKIYVDAGGMDNLIQAYIQTFGFEQPLLDLDCSPCADSALAAS